MSSAKQSYPLTELFRYTRLVPTAVVDVKHRERDPGWKGARKPADWADKFVAKFPANGPQLRFPYAEHLRPGVDSGKYLPSRDDLRDAAAFVKLDIALDERYIADLRLVRDMLLAEVHRSQGGSVEQQTAAARLLQFVELFPKLADAITSEPYAPLVTTRIDKRIKAPKQPAPNTSIAMAQQKATDLQRVALAVRTLWQVRNAHIESLYQARLELHKAQRADLRVKMQAVQAAGADKKAVKAAQKALDGARSKTKEALAEAVRKHGDAQKNTSLMSIVSTKAHKLPSVPGMSDAIDTLKDVGEKFGVKLGRFCQTYADALDRADRAGAAPAKAESQILSPESFESPTVDFADTVRILGRAELVRVDEEFIAYSAGEISYIQTVLAGEKRRREVRSENTSEVSSEQVQEELSERSEETSASTKAELKSQIETELRTRLDSSVNASGNASASGKLGVFDVDGGANVGASLGVGVDTGMKSKNESQFSQEIVQKGLERTTRRTMQRRLTRNVQTYASLDSHEIDNTGREMQNGTYVYLNRHVAIKETAWGQRLFLEARLLAPGRALASARIHRVRAAEERIGSKPVFTITPADITPANYMRLAGEYRAQGVEPPPAPITTLSRVYKTDTASASSEPEAFNGKKVADLLVPFFGQYKRFLITENVELPEGYEVADVAIAVAHGANGVSIPASLPFTLPATAAYAGASFPFMMGVLGYLFLPAWLWSVGFMASPLLHYNADSSNVTITVGTQAKDSAYFFFEPDELLQVVTELLRSIAAMSPEVVGSIKDLAIQAVAAMKQAALELPPEIGAKVGEALSKAVGDLKGVLDSLGHLKAKQALEKLGKLQAPNIDLANLPSVAKVFEPLSTFIEAVATLLTQGVSDVIARVFGALLDNFENSQQLFFGEPDGMRGKLPIAINALALKPGVTVNVTACLRRTDEALSRWQLRTFDALYQAHLQLVAAYESRAYRNEAAPDARAPTILRREEQAAIKERVLNTLNGLFDSSPSSYDIGKLVLFEHALDWESLSYRAFNYGPSVNELNLEQLGALAGADDRRRLFLTATWAQVMIPVQPHVGLEQQLLAYFRDGSGSVDAAAASGPGQMDELAALYQDLVQSRALGSERLLGTTEVVVPTDLVALYRPTLSAELPRNPAYAAAA